MYFLVFVLNIEDQPTNSPIGAGLKIGTSTDVKPKGKLGHVSRVPTHGTRRGREIFRELFVGPVFHCDYASKKRINGLEFTF